MSQTDDALSQLERDIRALKIEYEQYFGGGRARPPSDTEWRVEQTIKRFTERGAEMSYAQRFRFNNLTSTYAKYREVWRKRLKQKEEGFVPRHFGAAARAIEAERARTRQASASPPPQPDTVGVRIVCSDPDQEPEKIEQLYRALLEARQAAGEQAAPLHFENFARFVHAKTQQLRKTQGGTEVEYSIELEAGKVKLKVRVRK
ncbi:MAG: hypothetical protein K6U02_05575 [Firmicutes bacterium]|nr:hypothetical protein [Bacillota bacterium]